MARTTKPESMLGKKKIAPFNVFLHIFFVLSSLMFIVPFLLIVSASFEAEKVLIEGGFSLIPREFSIEAYRIALKDPTKIINSYAVTAFSAFFGTFVSLIIMSMCAYALSRPYYRLKSFLTMFIFITMIFSGGLVPSYILNTQYLKIGNNLWIYILPTLASAFYIIVIRTYFQSLPNSIVESAKIDGASEYTVFWRIMMPLSVPVLATVSLFSLLDRWNDWFTSLVYIHNEKLYSLQYFLQKMLMDAEFAKNMANSNLGIITQTVTAPTESMKFAMCVIAAGPMLFAFPFFQKYFVKGLTVGSVKG